MLAKALPITFCGFNRTERTIRSNWAVIDAGVQVGAFFWWYFPGICGVIFWTWGDGVVTGGWVSPGIWTYRASRVMFWTWPGPRRENSSGTGRTRRVRYPGGAAVDEAPAARNPIGAGDPPVIEAHPRRSPGVNRPPSPSPPRQRPYADTRVRMPGERAGAVGRTPLPPEPVS